MISRYLTLSGIPVNQMTLFTEIQTLIIYLAENVGGVVTVELVLRLTCVDQNPGILPPEHGIK